MVGVFFGSILVYFTLFKDRERTKSTWMPNERVLNSLVKGLDLESENFNCILSCCEMSTQEFKDLIETAKVNFDKSTPRTEPALYLVEAKNNNIKFEFSLKNDISKLIAVYPCFDKQTCDCD
jgi:hypothetical protein